MIEKNIPIIELSTLRVGDIALGYNSEGKISKKINNITGSSYTHAGIISREGFIAESMPLSGSIKGGISLVSIDDFVKRYEHVAFLRHPDIWKTPNRIQQIDNFVMGLIENNVNYNLKGVLKFTKNKAQHQSSLLIQLDDFFTKKRSGNSPYKTSYFCSEFICDCFIFAGAISESASILYKSDTLAPTDLANEPTFGYFLGYYSQDSNYKIPDGDFFAETTTYKEIFETEDKL